MGDLKGYLALMKSKGLSGVLLMKRRGTIVCYSRQCYGKLW